MEGLTLEQEAELLEQKRGKDFASMTERLGRLEELARCGVRGLPSLTDLHLNRVGAARTCHHLLKAGLRFSNLILASHQDPGNPATTSLILTVLEWVLLRFRFSREEGKLTMFAP